MSLNEAAACYPTPLAAPGSRESARPPEPISLEPASAYEAVTRQMVLALTEDLHEIKNRLNGLLFMVAGSLLLDVLLRLASGR
ncbi:MAG: hypothetical protein U0031_22200 [Thermomicrobiales bacterium]